MAKTLSTIGFIGAGRMATALARGCIENQLVPAEQVLAVDPSEAAREAFGKSALGAQVFDSPDAVLKNSDLVVLAVKPQVMATVLEGIAGHVTRGHLLVSIAAGIRLARLAAMLPAETRLIRVMPNTPCLIGRGASCYARSEYATQEDAQLVEQILASVGFVSEVEEELLDAVTGLSGSGPAFVYSMIEGLVAGAVQLGMQPELALQLAAQTTLGAAEMVLSTGQSPEELRNQVTSPGGTTMAGLEKLGQLDGSSAFAYAVVAAADRSVELGNA